MGEKARHVARMKREINALEDICVKS